MKIAAETPVTAEITAAQSVSETNPAQTTSTLKTINILKAYTRHMTLPSNKAKPESMRNS
jgi:hypothetical protein